MTSAEFDLLRTFCERPGRVLSRDSLLDLTQGRNAGSFERSIDVLVSRIRRKIEPDPQDATMIKTVRSGGYMFTPAVDAIAVGHRRSVMRLLDFLNLRNISGQIAALVIASIVAIHLILTAIFFVNRPDQPDPSVDRGHAQFAAAGAASRLGVPRPNGRGFSPTSRGRFRSSTSTNLPPGPVPRGKRSRRNRPARPASHGSTAVTGFSRSPTNEDSHKVGIALPDGAMISARILPDQRQRPFWGGPWMPTLLSAIVSVGLLGLWAARALTAPLSSFAKAAESFSLNGAAPPLPERGPEEIRSVAKALNRMRERITTLIDDRTRMLAAISHDLRTPITRMRLRAEFIEDDVHRHRMLGDLDQMRSMLESVLSFLRNDRKLESMTLTDIAIDTAADHRPVRRYGTQGRLRRSGTRHGDRAAGRSASQRHQSRGERGEVCRHGHDPPRRVA